MGVAVQARPLERDRELDALRHLLEAASGGEGRVVVVEGAAGIGKTRLLHAAREIALEAGLSALGARATELERDFPFGLVRQLFEPLVRAAEPDRRQALLEGAAAPAASALDIADRPSAERADEPRDPSFATLNALYWLTSNLAEEQPLLLVLDDAHWADDASLRFIKFMLPRIGDLPVALALAARTAEPGAAVDVVAELAPDPATEVLRPLPLSRDAVSELVRADLTRADGEFCTACHEATGGNPFMVRELLLELGAEGITGRAPEAAGVRELAPATIQRAVLARLARLPDETHRLARAVAVLGDDADPGQAAALADLEAEPAARAADALCRVGILERPRPLRFAHPLVRNAVYADQPGAERTDAHRRAAKLLAEQGAEAERVAVHLLVTDPVGEPSVAETLEQAARRALERGAPEPALAYLRRALAERPEAGARRALLRLLVPAWFRTSELRGFSELLDLDAIEEVMADPQLMLEAAPEISFAMSVSGRKEESVALLERAISRARETGDYDLAVRFESFLAVWMQLGPAEARARLDRHRDEIEPETPGERVLLAMDGLWDLFAGQPRAKAAAQGRRAAAGGRIFDEHSENLVPSAACMVLLWTDQLDAADTAIAHNLSTARARGAPGDVGGARILGAELALVRGEVTDAEEGARAAVEAARQGGFLLQWPSWLALLVEVLVERDEPTAAQAELDAAGVDERVPEGWYSGPLLYSRARLRLAQGRADAALEDLMAVGGRLAEAGAQPQYACSYLSLALAAAGQQEQARQAAEWEVSEARAWGSPRRTGFALRALALLKGEDEGLRLLREALELLGPSQARLEYARALADYGAALRRANRRAQAREPLQEALELARRGGAIAIARHAHEELEATGEKVGPLLRGGVESLTPSERRSAELAAEGLSNRQIAQSSFLSVKTVESHLRGAYRKLDISSRRELPRALEAGGGRVQG